MNIIDSNLDRVKLILFSILVILLAILTYQIISEVQTATHDVLAQSVLRKISDALEKYREENGFYPRNLKQLMIEEYPYRIDAYFKGTHHGFRFTCDISADQYTISAEPVSEENSGVTYRILSGGKMIEERTL